jgi:hypothetical protein
MEAPMRIILFLAAAAAAATSGPAPAQTSSMTAQHGHPHATARGSDGWILRPQPDFRRGSGGHRDGHRGRHRGRFDGDGLLYPYGFAGSVDMMDTHGNGFFAGNGGGIRMRGGRPLYDYDRSYPYEWASGAAGSAGWAEREDESRPSRNCSIELGVRVCRGRR